MTKKMTRKEALETAIEIVTEYRHVSFGEDDFSATHTEEVLSVLQNMVAQIDKQAARPKSKSSARVANEPIAREFIKVLAKEGNPLSAKEMTYKVRFCTTSQKAVAIAKIAEEWGAIEKVTIKNRVFYRLNPDFEIPLEW